MDPTKLNGIKNWPTPIKVKDVHSYLGFTNFYRKVIGDYSNIAHPLLNITKKDTPWTWNNSCQNTFNRLKNCFLTKPILHLPNTSTSPTLPNPSPLPPTPPSMHQVVSSYRQTLMENGTHAPTFPNHSDWLNETMIFTIGNSLPSFRASKLGTTICRDPHPQYWSLPIIKTSHSSNKHRNLIGDKPEEC